MPTAKTAQEYRRLAEHFYKQRLSDEPPSPKRITDALVACAGEYRPAYWRRLRCALALDQQEKGYKQAAERIKGTINPMTTDAHGPLDKGLRGVVPAKQRRAKSITPEDAQRLSDEVAARISAAEGTEKIRWQELMAALYIAGQLGVRPSEMSSLRFDQAAGTVHVTGAKKSGERGADRVLRMPSGAEATWRSLAAAAKLLRGMDNQGMHRIQSRLERFTRKLWPRRAVRPTLYTFRHKMGSALKASGVSRAAIAYVMGHQSTKSVEVYGDRRAAKRSGGLTVQVGEQEAQAFEGRENHTQPHEPRLPAAPAVQQEGSDPPPPAPSSGPGMG